MKERFVLLDMEATGTKVLAAQSMSEDWAVTATELGPAPTWDRDGQEKEGLQEGRGMMLRIKGVEVGKEAGQEKGKEAGIGGPDWEEKRLEELVEFYERRMVELRRVVNAGVGIGD